MATDYEYTDAAAEGGFFRYVQQDGISQWWKESISFAWANAEREQWRRIWWLIQWLDKIASCDCDGDLDYICTFCWTMANARQALGGSYARYSPDPQDAYGYSHGAPTRDPIPARPEKAAV